MHHAAPFTPIGLPARVKRQADGRGPDDAVFMGKELEGDTRRAAFGTYVITSHGSPLKERKLADVAKERGKHAVDLMLDLALEDLDTRLRASQLNFVEDEVREIIKDPNVVIGLGDGGAHLSQLCDACYSTHLLGHWVREDGALTLEQAVHRLTGATAVLFGLHDRGRLAVGLPADIVVFDPATVGPRRSNASTTCRPAPTG